MGSLSTIISICTVLLLPLLLIQPTNSQQSYDNTNCTSGPQLPGSNYLCNSERSCETFIVYRVQESNRTLSYVASLFSTNLTQLQSQNKIMGSDSNDLPTGREIIVPIECSCPDRYSQAVFEYNTSYLQNSLSTIACQVFEGLVKAQTLSEKNPDKGANMSGNSLIQVPIRCACPSTTEKAKGITHLVTYPILEHDQVALIALKFGVPEQMILDANELDPFFNTIFPQTTLLIPTKAAPILNLSVNSPPPNPGPREVIPVREIVSGTKSSTRNFLIITVGIIFAMVSLLVIACGTFVVIRRKYHRGSFRPLSSKRFLMSPFTPDFLDGMSKLKHSLICFSLEELRIATEDFSSSSVIGKAVYRGRIGGSVFAIEQMDSVEAGHHVVDILTRINHLNVVKLEGCCYETSCPYLVFEFAEKGSLRDCLSNAKISKQFSWKKRMQIAFDLAVGLHYIHYCTKPTYVHRNINSRNVLITIDWRAKISGFRLARPVICIEEKEDENWNESVVVGKKEYLAPEYLNYGQASTKVDVYAFGVVLLELLSAKEVITEENLLKDSVRFLADGAFEESSGCLEKLKGFMDPVLEGDYPLGDAMCLALLARGCVEEELLHRPNMNDVLKTLSRILS
ncbi:hypothetical protein RJ639_016299 [Escallonia herrerae]|uniref:Uncharacterized protein n=1 Tax=Escallonia herrerae TaxID=1293975 RepID=A0AA88VCR1_9ASTE|nr:hypothetical protein RJ639_016299 [Escallonia herrerae]